MNKQLFIAVAKDHFSFRWHMVAILGATGLTAAVMNICLYAAGMHDMSARYPVVTLLSYFGFLVWMKIWTWFLVSPSTSDGVSVDPGDIVDLLDCVSNYPYTSRPVTIHRSVLDQASSAIGNLDIPAGHAADAGSSALDAASSVGDVAGSADEGIIVVIPIIIIGTLLAVILGIGSSLIMEAPLILGETLFECCLGAGLFVGARSWNKKRNVNNLMEKAADASEESGKNDALAPHNANWLGTAVGLTLKPFALAALLALFIGLTAEACYPGATCMAEVGNGYQMRKSGKMMPRKPISKPLAEAFCEGKR